MEHSSHRTRRWPTAAAGAAVWRPVTSRSVAAAGWWFVIVLVAVGPLITTNFTGLTGIEYPFTADQIELPRAVLLGVCAGMALALVSASRLIGKPVIVAPKFGSLLAVFVVLVSMSAVVSNQPLVAVFGDYRRYEGLLAVIACASLFLIGAQVNSVPRLSVLAVWMCVSGSLVAGYGILQVLGYDPVNWLSNVVARRAFSTWGNPDFLSGYLLFPISYGTALVMSRGEPWARLLGATATGLGIVAVVLSQTRGGWLALLVLLIAFVLLWPMGGRRRLSWLVAVLALTVVASAVAQVASHGLFLDRIIHSFDRGDSGLAARMRIWEIGLPAIWERPLLGAGPDTYAHLGLGADNAHNMVLQQAVTLGIPAAVTYVVFFAAVLMRRIRARVCLATTDDHIACAAYIAVAAHLVYLLSGVSLVLSDALMFLSAGIAVASSSPRIALRRRYPLVVSCGIGAVLVALTLLTGATALRADHAFLNARISARSGDASAWLESSQRAVELWPWNDRYIQELREVQTH